MAGPVRSGDGTQDIALLDDPLSVRSLNRPLDGHGRGNVPSQVLEGRDLGRRLRVTHHGQLSVAHLLARGSFGIHRLVVHDLAVRVEVRGDELSEIQTGVRTARLGDRHHAQLPLPGLRGIEIRSGLGFILLNGFPRRWVSPVDLEDRDTLVRPQHVERRAGAIDHEGNGDHKEDHDHREGSQDGCEDTPADDRCTFRRSLLEGQEIVD